MRCRHCTEAASWFSSEHADCKRIRKAGGEDIQRVAAKYAIDGVPPDYEEKLISLASASYNLERQVELTLAGVQEAFKKYLSSENDNPTLENNLYYGALTLLPVQQRSQVPMKRLEMKATLRGLSLGQRASIKPSNNIKSLLDAKTGEFSIWTFHDVGYFEERTHKYYVGRSSSVSYRVIKGISVRVGKSQGHVVEKSSLDRMDTGSLTITNKRLHFMGSHKAFRLFYDKLSLIQPYSDGLKIIRDNPSAKPQVFVFDDGWFASEVFQRL